MIQGDTVKNGLIHKELFTNSETLVYYTRVIISKEREF